MARPLSPRGQGRGRVVDAAVALFAVHGVSGTSLQMIADQMGVTKAAVYYQFQAKEDIVLAVVESAFADMERFLAEAESAPTADQATDTALRGLVDLMIAHRQVIASLARDPEVARIVESHHEYASLTQRLTALLLGPGPDLRRRVVVSVVAAGLAQAGTDRQLADVHDDTLRTELVEVGAALLRAGTAAHHIPDAPRGEVRT